MTALEAAGERSGEKLREEMQALGRAARAAAATLARASAEQRTDALNRAAAAIRTARGAILEANRRDLQSAHDKQLSSAMIDRLMLDDQRIEAMANGLAEVASLPDPVGTVLAAWTRPNGLKIERVRVPLGVIGIIYESRPNVTADAGGLCIRSGNAAILRGGSESFHSSRAIVAAIETGLERAKLPRAAVQLVPTTDRAAVGHMLAMNDLIDVVVPRGGRSLIERVQTESRLPVIAHLEGVCHVYLDHAADPAKARKIVLNAKMRRTGVCGAAETLLVDRAVAAKLLPPILADLRGAGCEIRGDEAVRALDRDAKAATEQDWHTEYLDAILAVKVVDGLDAAIRHVNHYGSHHTDAIVTEEKAAAEKFLNEVDSAIVLVNASTQFADGGEFGMGAEIGISTGRLPPRGPVGAEQLTSFKYVVRGNGQVRP
ncbi:MAG: glutamate-5-semialdehyde dehydrogenase [Alphaproteobacteria bacterium]|nr:glutamate-5-semialdehyde dehydrogenase [Alphaproteobacteria bacterium]